VPRGLSTAALSIYRLWARVAAKAISVLIGGSFATFGERSVIELPVRIKGEARISIGDDVFVGANSWLQTLQDGDNREPAIVIGSGTSVAGGCVLSAQRQIVIEDHVLLARNVYVSDHRHRYEDAEVPILAQGVTGISPVTIRRGSWIGQNVVVCPGVTIGVGAVVAANSVVKEDVPDRTMVAGAPAKVVRRLTARSSVPMTK
jgi:acetyltransferase-like isoleucine patch superfamily enzyme